MNVGISIIAGAAIIAAAIAFSGRYEIISVETDKKALTP